MNYISIKLFCFLKKHHQKRAGWGGGSTVMKDKLTDIGRKKKKKKENNRKATASLTLDFNWSCLKFHSEPSSDLGEFETS